MNLVWGEDVVVEIKMQAAANNKAAVKQASVGKGQDGGVASSTTDQTSSSTSADGPGLGAESNSLGTSSSATSEVDKGGGSSCHSCDH